MMRHGFLIGVGCWFLSGSGWASGGPSTTLSQELHQHFIRANQAYAVEQDYETAILEYQKVLAFGVRHPDLYFNLANAYYRAGKLGLAVLWYEKTLWMNPADEKAARNLSVVQKELIDRMAPTEGGGADPLWHDYIRKISANWITVAFLICYVAAFVILIARRMMSERLIKRFLFWVNVPLLSLTVVFGIGLFSSVYVRENVRQGVVISPTAPLLEGPEKFANKQMELHQGLKVRILNEVGEFLRVRLPIRAEGFIHDSHIGRIAP